MIEKGVCYVKDILDKNGSFLPYDRFNVKYDVNINYITYTGYIQAIRSYARKQGIGTKDNKSLVMSKSLKLIFSVNKGTKLYYDVLMKNESEPKYCNTWNE